MCESQHLQYSHKTQGTMLCWHSSQVGIAVIRDRGGLHPHMQVISWGQVGPGTCCMPASPHCLLRCVTDSSDVYHRHVVPEVFCSA